MIDINKKYKTRDGRSVRILCTDRNHKNCVVAIITAKNGYPEIFAYNADGRTDDTIDRRSDLIEVTPYEHLKMDDKIMVSDDGISWEYRHFAKVLYGVVYAFENGKTSWSTKEKGGTLVPWKYVADENGIELI